MTVITGCAHKEVAQNQPNQILQAKEDIRLKLAQLTMALGKPLPPPQPSDALGVETLPGNSQRVFGANAPQLADADTRIRFTSWNKRVHTIEITFPKGCNTQCAALFFETLNEWLAASSPIQQGNAQILVAQMDTVQVTFEWFPEKSDVSRLLVQCQPLYAAAHHRPSRLPGVGQKIEIERMPRCRPLMP